MVPRISTGGGGQASCLTPRNLLLSGLTAIPKSPSAMAILAVVRRDHFMPVMGSPAVS